MKYFKISDTDLNVSNIIMGCMRIKQLSIEETEKLIKTAMEEGINFFDHADIYGGGQCETIFSQALKLNSDTRENIILQSKCGIRNGFYDFSKEYILKSTDEILKRLNTEYLDILLLHRPDILMEPEEVAEAFDILYNSGKVRYFGVSNQNPMQIELLQKYLNKKLIINQLQLSIAHTPIIDSSIAVNMNIAQSINREGSILDYCRLKNITIQAWSPFQKGFFEGTFLEDNEKYKELNEVIDLTAKKYNVTNTAIAVSFITRHPANIQVILGTTNLQRMKDACRGSELLLSRQEWYSIYKAAGNIIP